MAEEESKKNIQYFYDENSSTNETFYKVLHVFTKEGSQIHIRNRICELESPNGTSAIIKSALSGVVKNIFIQNNSDIKVGCALLQVEECSHPTMLGNICCDCGSVLNEEVPTDSKDHSSNTLVSMLHSIPDLKVSRQEAERLGMEDINHLLENKKLVLLVDLDQTLIHTTNDNIPPNLKDVYHFQLIKNGPWYHTRIRPFTKKFLQSISKLYELHICTFGVREYAHYIAHFLDPDKKLFGHRILSRNECLDPLSKMANLSSLFPCGDNLVCIMDDRSDVWHFAPNVVQVLPYHFFQHTGDINAPVELQKKENDDMEGFDFSKIESTINQKIKDSEDKDHSSVKDSDEDGPSSTKNSGAEKDKTNIINEDKELTTSSDFKESSTKCQISKKFKDDVSSLIDSNEEEVNRNGTSLDRSSCSDIDYKNRTHTLNELDSDLETTFTYDAESDVLDVPDSDDYLLYLEDILVKLHKQFYDIYTSNKSVKKVVTPSVMKELPDLKTIVPSLKNKVLCGVHIVFSGVIPHHMDIECSKPYHTAVSLGATISKKIVTKKCASEKGGNVTTHVIAANLHTEKVHQAKRHKYIKIVTPNWLWCCAERWEKVEEKLFTVEKISPENILRNPPMHCCVQPLSSQIDKIKEAITEHPHTFADDLNPLAFMSNDEAKSMEEEVDVVLSSDDDDEDFTQNTTEKESSLSSISSTSSDDPPSAEEDEGHDILTRKKRQKKRPHDLLAEEADSDDELPSVRFRQGGSLPTDESGPESDDDDLNAYGDILERELLD